MTNMSYCKYENTLAELREIYENIGEIPQDADEQKARAKLIKLCQKIGEYSKT